MCPANNFSTSHQHVILASSWTCPRPWRRFKIVFNSTQGWGCFTKRRTDMVKKLRYIRHRAEHLSEKETRTILLKLVKYSWVISLIFSEFNHKPLLFWARRWRRSKSILQFSQNFPMNSWHETIICWINENSRGRSRNQDMQPWFIHSFFSGKHPGTATKKPYHVENCVVINGMFSVITSWLRVCSTHVAIVNHGLWIDLLRLGLPTTVVWRRE